MGADNTVLVIGATGNVGPLVVRQLIDEGVTTRALLLADDPRAGRLPDEGFEVFHGDLADPDSLLPALDGVESVLLMWPFFTLNVDTAPAVLERIARQARRVVFVSSIGVHIGYEHTDNNCHAYLEELIEKTGLEWTFLQTTGFAANARLSYAQQMKATGIVRSPYGAAARSSIHEGDVAAVAVRALRSSELAGRRLVVTGPEVLTQIEQVKIIGEIIGTEPTWQDVPAEAALKAMVSAGWPPAYASGALEYFEMLTKEPELITTTVQDVLGRPPRTFREWAVEFADDFR
ncbi:NAD(P)H-binding protein [Streptomyces sp. NPDC102365]|uniref:NmrA family NAD(P)-binding protein n=1 Tax=Streptomyces sp. NPDC102365 TaxID=3366162 RepID=UPI00381AEE09